MALDYSKTAHLKPELPGGKTNYIGDIILELNNGISSNGIRPRGYETLGIQDNNGILNGTGISLQTFADGSVYYGDGDENLYTFGYTLGLGMTETHERCMFGTEFTISGTPISTTILTLSSYTAAVAGTLYITGKTSYGTMEITKNGRIVGYGNYVADCKIGDVIGMKVVAPIMAHVDTAIRVTECSIYTNSFGAYAEDERQATQLDYDIYLPNNEFLFFVEYEGIPQDRTIQLIKDKHIGIDYELTSIEIANIKKYSTTSTNRLLAVFYRGSVTILVNGKIAATKKVMKMKADASGNMTIIDTVNEPIEFLKHFGAKVFKVLVLSNVDSLILDQYRLERISIDGFEEGYVSKELVPLFTQYETGGTGGGGLPPVVMEGVFVGVYARWADVPSTIFGQQWGIAGEGFYEQTGSTNASRKLLWGCASDAEIDLLFV